MNKTMWLSLNTNTPIKKKQILSQMTRLSSVDFIDFASMYGIIFDNETKIQLPTKEEIKFPNKRLNFYL